jgi:hypothetical protein
MIACCAADPLWGIARSSARFVYILPANTNTRPSLSLEASDFIHIAVESSRQRSAALIRRGIKVDALDARRQPILELVDDREVAGQIMSERLLNLLPACKRVEFPYFTL